MWIVADEERRAWGSVPDEVFARITNYMENREYQYGFTICLCLKIWLKITTSYNNVPPVPAAAVSSVHHPRLLLSLGALTSAIASDNQPLPLLLPSPPVSPRAL